MAGAQVAAAKPAPAAQHKQAASAMSGGVAAVTAFLQSKEGKKMQKEVVRGVFGMIKKRLLPPAVTSAAAMSGFRTRSCPGRS